MEQAFFKEDNSILKTYDTLNNAKTQKNKLNFNDVILSNTIFEKKPLGRKGLVVFHISNMASEADA